MGGLRGLPALHCLADGLKIIYVPVHHRVARQRLDLFFDEACASFDLFSIKLPSSIVAVGPSWR